MNRWLREGKDVNVMLPYLMRYMGHSDVKNILYNSHLVPDIYGGIVDRSRHSEGRIPLPPRVCLKIAFRQMCVTICGRFDPNEGGVVGYVDRMRAKSPAKWGVHLAGMNFQTHSSMPRLTSALVFWKK